MPVAVTFENVSRSFRDFWGRQRVQAVRELSLKVPEGEIFGLLGPNGSGKTTSLSLLLGLLRPDGGRIEVLGLPPGDRHLKRRVGYLPEEFSPPELLTGEEVLRYYGGFHRIPGKELNARIQHYLDLLDLRPAGRRRFRNYSKGMQRRIGLAQALLHRPDLVVLDEPTNGLDPMGVRTVKSLLVDLRAEGRTVLISSHILPELEEICDRIAILHRGSCVCSGPTAELLRLPDRFQLVLEKIDAGRAREAGRLLAEKGYQVGDVRPLEQSLERLFLDQVQE